MPMKFNLSKYSNPVFLETGTYKGEGISRALKAGFQKIYSIEIAAKFYDRALEKFEKEIAEGTVEIIFGDSLLCLSDVIKQIDCSITFWLDAHTQEGYQGQKSCPLYEELDVIANHPIKTHTLLIDDWRLFEEKGWGKNIAKDTILEKIKKINTNYSIAYENGFIENDVLVASVAKDKKLKLETSLPNLALHKPAKQSSFLNSNTNKPEAAVSGIKNGKFSFHTNKELNPWWQVDLEAECVLSELHVYNRIDTAAERSKTLSVLLSLDGKTWETVYVNNQNFVFGGVDGAPLAVPLRSKNARYVRLQLNEENYLHLDEVEVYGTAQN